MSAATSSRRARAWRRSVLAAALALALIAAPGAMAADGVLATTAPPQVTPVRNAAGALVALQCTSAPWLETSSGRTVAPLLSYSWLANALPVGGATSSLYAVEASDTGKSLTCAVNAVFALGSAGTVTTFRGIAYSAPFLVVQPSAPAPPVTVTRVVGAATLVMPRLATRTVDPSGRVTIASSVTCGARCTVLVAATTRIGRATYRSELRRTVGTTSRKLILVLPRSARAALARAKRGRVTVVVTVRSAGGVQATLRRTLTLRPA